MTFAELYDRIDAAILLMEVYLGADDYVTDQIIAYYTLVDNYDDLVEGFARFPWNETPDDIFEAVHDEHVRRW